MRVVVLLVPAGLLLSLSNTDFISKIKASKGNFGSLFLEKEKVALFWLKKYIRYINLHIINILLKICTVLLI